MKLDLKVLNQFYSIITHFIQNKAYCVLVWF